MVNQIPQGKLATGDVLPPYKGANTTKKIYQDYKNEIDDLVPRCGILRTNSALSNHSSLTSNSLKSQMEAITSLHVPRLLHRTGSGLSNTSLKFQNSSLVDSSNHKVVLGFGGSTNPEYAQILPLRKNDNSTVIPKGIPEPKVYGFTVKAIDPVANSQSKSINIPGAYPVY
jgi:hypothetical protein